MEQALFGFCNDPASKLSSPNGVSRGICECRRHLTFTFRWSAKTKVEGRISKHLNYLGVVKAPRARGRNFWE